MRAKKNPPERVWKTVNALADNFSGTNARGANESGESGSINSHFDFLQVRSENSFGVFYQLKSDTAGFLGNTSVSNAATDGSFLLTKITFSSHDQYLKIK